MVARFAAVMRRVHVLTADDWQRLLYATCAISVRDCRPHGTAKEWPAIDGVLALLDRAANGEAVSHEEWRAAAYRAAADAYRAAADAYRAAAAAAYRAAAAAAAACDRITAAHLGAIEQACARREATQPGAT
jgi:hypothetical protein